MTMIMIRFIKAKCSEHAIYLMVNSRTNFCYPMDAFFLTLVRDQARSESLDAPKSQTRGAPGPLYKRCSRALV